jgi:hypothetical protein
VWNETISSLGSKSLNTYTKSNSEKATSSIHDNFPVLLALLSWSVAWKTKQYHCLGLRKHFSPVYWHFISSEEVGGGGDWNTWYQQVFFKHTLSQLFCNVRIKCYLHNLQIGSLFLPIIYVTVEGRIGNCLSWNSFQWLLIFLGCLCSSSFPLNFITVTKKLYIDQTTTNTAKKFFIFGSNAWSVMKLPSKWCTSELQ